MASTAPGSKLLSRIHNSEFAKKVVNDPKSLISLFKDGQYMGWSGFTGVGSPKVMTQLLAEHVEENNLQGKLRFNLFVGASGGNIEDRWAANNMIAFRSPHQVGKNIGKNINNGLIEFQDKHLSLFAQDLLYGYYTKNRTDKKHLDITILEASKILPDGQVIPTTSVGATPELAELADKIIIEINTTMPDFEGLHDIHMPLNPPNRREVPIYKVDDRAGTLGMKIDPSKVVAIIESTDLDTTGPNAPEDAVSQKISEHLLGFLEHEVSMGRLPKNLHPLQSGIGNIANAVIGGLKNASFSDLTVFTEVLQDTFLPLIRNGKISFASATSVRLSPEMFDIFYKDFDYFKSKVLLRPQVISNSPEVIRRLGCIAMNTPVEVDMYGHANSTCVAGSKMLHGLGGSADFLRNAKLSVMHTPSVRPSKVDPTGITCIVPFVSHIDQTEHDLDVIVTEQGIADLRGLSPVKRAHEIIRNCAHPHYKPLLLDYLETNLTSCRAIGAGHEPHNIFKAFKMYENLKNNGTMKIDSW